MQKTIRHADKIDFPQWDRFIQYKDDGKLLAAQDVARILVKLLERKELHEIRYEAMDLKK